MYAHKLVQYVHDIEHHKDQKKTYEQILSAGWESLAGTRAQIQAKVEKEATERGLNLKKESDFAMYETELKRRLDRILRLEHRLFYL